MRKSIALVSIISLCALTFGCETMHSHEHDIEVHVEEGEGENLWAEMSEEEMMEMMMKLAAPGEGHEIFASLVGTWNVEMSMLMEPGAEPSVSEGTMVNTTILGGRFLQNSFEGTSMGMDFGGFGLLGFNNSTGEYEGLWVDTFGTMMPPLSHGSYDSETGVLTMHRKMNDPNFGTMEMREVITIESNDRHTMEMFMQAPEGEYRNLHIVYTRQ